MAYSTLNDLANGKVEIESCKVGLLAAVADALGLTLDEAAQVCRPGRHAVVTEYGTETNIRVRNKSYFAEFEYDGVRTEIELCRVNEDTTFYINEIAKWRSEPGARAAGGPRQKRPPEKVVAEPADPTEPGQGQSDAGGEGTGGPGRVPAEKPRAQPDRLLLDPPGGLIPQVGRRQSFRE